MLWEVVLSMTKIGRCNSALSFGMVKEFHDAGEGDPTGWAFSGDEKASSRWRV